MSVVDLVVHYIKETMEILTTGWSHIRSETYFPLIPFVYDTNIKPEILWERSCRPEYEKMCNPEFHKSNSFSLTPNPIQTLVDEEAT